MWVLKSSCISVVGPSLWRSVEFASSRPELPQHLGLSCCEQLNRVGRADQTWNQEESLDEPNNLYLYFTYQACWHAWYIPLRISSIPLGTLIFYWTRPQNRFLGFRKLQSATRTKILLLENACRKNLTKNQALTRSCKKIRGTWSSIHEKCGNYETFQTIGLDFLDISSNMILPTPSFEPFDTHLLGILTC